MQKQRERDKQYIRYLKKPKVKKMLLLLRK